MVRCPWRYPWSSAAVHCGKVFPNPLLDLTAWRETMSYAYWVEALSAFAENAKASDAIRRNTHMGRPLGSDSFMSKLEALMDRRLCPLPTGRQTGWRKAETVKTGKQKERKMGRGGKK